MQHNIVVRRADEIPLPLKAAVEELLGRTIAPDEEISVVATPPQGRAPSGGKAAIAAKLEVLLDCRAEKVKDLPEAEIDQIIDEAVSEARRSRR
jgi:hypothetical protein